jgi:hypothetical protein
MRQRWPAVLVVTALCALVPAIPSAGAGRTVPRLVLETTFHLTEGAEVAERMAPLSEDVDIPAAVLAPGVQLDPGGALHGVATRAGAYSEPITLCAGATCAEEWITVVVHPDVPWRLRELTFGGSAGRLLDGEIGVEGGPQGVLPTFTVTDRSALPAGVTIGPDGHVGGVPPRSGVSQVPVRACLAGDCAGAVVTLIVA